MDSFSEIGSLQIRVLRILWDRGDGTVHEVLEAFSPQERPAYTTVLQVLRTLEKRGLVGHTQQHRQYRYRPLVQPEKVEAGAVNSLLSRIFSGNAERLVARLLDARSLDPEELESLRALIDAREAELAAGRGGK